MTYRRQELLDLIKNAGVDNDIKAGQVIDEIVFIENELIELKKLPFLNINPKNPMQQKATPASKQYKELLQQYNNCLRLLFMLTGDLGGEPEEDSPLRAWARSRQERL